MRLCLCLRTACWKSLELLTTATDIFREKCVDVLEACPERCRHLLENSYAFATEYTQYLGYDTVSKIVKENQGDVKKIHDILENMKKA